MTALRLAPLLLLAACVTTPPPVPDTEALCRSRIEADLLAPRDARIAFARRGGVLQATVVTPSAVDGGEITSLFTCETRPDGTVSVRLLAD